MSQDLFVDPDGFNPVLGRACIRYLCQKFNLEEIDQETQNTVNGSRNSISKHITTHVQYTLHCIIFHLDISINIYFIIDFFYIHQLSSTHYIISSNIKTQQRKINNNNLIYKEQFIFKKNQFITLISLRDL